MARIHQATLNFELDRVVYTPEVLLIDLFEYINKFLPASSDEMAWMLSSRKCLLKAFDEADLTEIRQGTVHMVFGLII